MPHHANRRRYKVAALGLTALLTALCNQASPAAAGQSHPGICDASRFGARGDGHTDDTAALQHAIDTCAARGGGRVVLSGRDRTFISGPITLRSHVNLDVQPTVTLKAVADTSRFTWGFVGHTFNQSAAPGSSQSEALITAKDAVDVAITGGGTIAGQGDEMYWALAKAVKTDIARFPQALTFAQLSHTVAQDPTTSPAMSPTDYEALGTIPTSNGLPRPWLVEFYDASQVRVEDVTLTDSPMWCLGLRYSEHVTIRNLVVRNPSDSPNTDGVDVVSSDDVRMSHLDISTGDDDVAIKSGFPGFATPAVPATNIGVTHSTFGAGHGLSIGSEADNGVHGLKVSDVTFHGTDNGIRIKSGRDRGADLSDVDVRKARMTDVKVPILLTDYYTGLPKPGVDHGQQVGQTTPWIHDVRITDLEATGAQRSQLIGLPEAPLERITLAHVSITGGPGSTGLELRNAQVALHDVHVKAATAPGLVIEEGVDLRRW